MEVTRNPAAGLGGHQIGCICVNVKNHVTGVVANVGIGIGVEIVHQTLSLLFGLFCRTGLSTGYFIQSRKNGVVDCSSKIQE